MSSVTLGLDPANLTGWAIGENDKIIAFGCEDIAKRATQARCENVTYMYGWLRKMIKEHNVTGLCAEDAAMAFNSVASVKSHARYAAIIDLVCEQLNVSRISSVPPTTLKKWATGSGKSEKPQMIAAARRLYEIDVTDDNAADACHVCVYAMAQLKLKKNLHDRIPW